MQLAHLSIILVQEKEKPFYISPRQVYLGKAIRTALKGLEVTVGNSSYSQ